MNSHDIIIEPIITERSAANTYAGKYTFKVAKSASKTQIRKACEELFNVKVVAVNTLNVLGKKKRVGTNQGFTSAWKKAIVTIDTNPEPETYLNSGGKVEKSNKKYKDRIEEFGFGV